MTRRPHLALLLACALGGGCMVGPDYHPPAVETPSAWGELSPPSESGHQAPDQAAMWWTVFNDPS